VIFTFSKNFGNEKMAEAVLGFWTKTRWFTWHNLYVDEKFS